MVERMGEETGGPVRGRKLPQYLAVYVGACAGFLQLLDIAVERLPLEERHFTMAFIGCALGLPLVVAAALLRELAARDSVTRTRRSRRTIFGWSAVVMFLLIAAVAAPRAAAHWSSDTQGIRTAGAVLLASVTSRTADSALAGVLTDALTIDFEKDPAVVLVDQRTLADAMALDGVLLTGAPTGEQALRYAGRAGASGVIEVEINSAGPSYMIMARLLTAAGERVTSARETAVTEQELWTALDRVSRELRSAARTLPAAAVDNAAVPSAPEPYIAAARALRRGDGEAAESALRATLAADSAFVPALRNLGELMYARGDTAAGRTLLTTARTGAESLSGRERHLALGSYYELVENDAPRASVNYRRVLESDPADSVARHRLAALKRDG